MKCSKCGATPATTRQSSHGEERLPRGWKRRADDTFCAKCWQSLYQLRTIVFPVAGPLNREDWPRLSEALKKAWNESTRLANWAVTQLVKSDIVRAPDLKKLPAFKTPYLYPEARKICPEIDSGTVVAILNTVSANYGKRRIETIWRGRASVQRFRYPFSYKLPAQRWKARWLSEKERVPVVSLRIMSEEFNLRLRGGPEFSRQLTDFDKLISGDATPCEMSLGRQKANGSGSDNHRVGIHEREPGGGAQTQWNVMCRIAAWVPKVETKKESSSLLVRTEKERFLVANPESATPWIINGDQVLRWQAEHRRRLQHLREDNKYETMRNPNQRQQMKDRFEKWASKHHRRIDTWCHQVSASVANLAARQKISAVEYDDTHTIIKEFPWFRLRTLVERKLNALGICFTCTTSAAQDETSSGSEST